MQLGHKHVSIKQIFVNDFTHFKLIIAIIIKTKQLILALK